MKNIYCYNKKKIVSKNNGKGLITLLPYKNWIEIVQSRPICHIIGLFHIKKLCDATKLKTKSW